MVRDLMGGGAGSAGDTEDAATELLDEEMTEVLGRALGRAAFARGNSVRHWQLACVVEPSFENLLGLGAALCMIIGLGFSRWWAGCSL